MSLNNTNTIEVENFEQIIDTLNLQKLNINMDELYSEVLVLREVL